MRRGVVVVVGILGLGAAGAWWTWGRAEAPPAWRTATVERDDVRQLVSATGTLEAVQTVEVGAQVSGIVAALGADFNDRVERGQVLARIDPALLEADVAAAAARLAEERATTDRLALELGRIEKLHVQRVATDAELDTARADHAVATAQLKSAQVALDRARRNLGYATITAPIAGTVIRRDVEVGQTVNAGLSAPKLFLLAGDLARLRILAAVDESDIGQIREGQAATFTVQAFPDRTFSGTVNQVRLQSATAESVVTYTVVVDVENPDGVLLPGMTATVEFVVAEEPGAVCVSSAALRYRPDETVPIVGGDAAGASGASQASTAGGASAPGAKGASAGGKGARGGGRKPRADADEGTLWLPEGQALRALPVKIGLRGASCVVVSGEGVEEGLVVVTGVDRSEAAGGASSPFGTTDKQQRRPGGF